MTFLFFVTFFAFGADTPLSFGFDPGILKNDKEAVTHAFTHLEFWAAQRKLGAHAPGSTSDQAFQLLTETFNEIESKGPLCDLGLMQEFKAKLAAHQLSSTHEMIVNLLILWRSQNLIDDLFFEIIEQASYLIETMEGGVTNPLQLFPEKRALRILKKKKIESSDLESQYSILNGFSRNRLGCALEAWNSISTNLGLMALNPEQVTLLSRHALKMGAITDESFAIAEKMNEANAQTFQLGLSKYLGLIKSVKNRMLPENRTDSDLKPNALSSKLKSKREGITYRQNLYARFNSIQISMIAEVFKKTLNRMDATKTEIVFTFNSGSETVPVSPMGQYYLARKLLRKELYELSQSSFFGGMGITHEDLLTASLEMGLINADMVDSALTIDDLWNPEVKPWKKIADYAFRVTGTATIFLPPPYNIISSIALVFIDGLITKKTTKPSQADPSYDFF